MIVILKYLIPKSFNGLAIFPFIFLKDKKLKENKIVINHEKIHLKQQVELFWILFFIWYLVEFFIKLIIYKSANKAYKNISFEKEAYTNEKNLAYNNYRKRYAFLSYI